MQSYIECLDSDSNDQNVIAAHAEERTRFEEAYFQLTALYNGLVDSNKRKLFPNRSVVVLIKSHKITQIKLSRMQLPVFSGVYQDWFMIHSINLFMLTRVYQQISLSAILIKR